MFIVNYFKSPVDKGAQMSPSFISHYVLGLLYKNKKYLLFQNPFMGVPVCPFVYNL